MSALPAPEPGPKRKYNYTKKTGRPTVVSPALKAEICDEIANGKSYQQLIKDKKFSCMASLYRWMEADPEFRANVERAQEIRAEGYADELISIADDKRLDPNDRRVRLDARWKVVGSLLYRRYGAKQTVDINQNINIAVVHAEQLMALTQAAKETPQIEDHSLIEGEIVE